MMDGGLRALFRSHLPQFCWTSIETGGTGQGIADSNYLHAGGVEGWVEYKLTDTFRVKESDSWPFQVAWIDRRARLGGRAMVAVRLQHNGGPRKGPPVDDLYMVAGCHARALRADGLRGVPHWRTAGGPARWDWPGVAALLKASPERPEGSAEASAARPRCAGPRGHQTS